MTCFTRTRRGISKTGFTRMYVAGVYTIPVVHGCARELLTTCYTWNAKVRVACRDLYYTCSTQGIYNTICAWTRQGFIINLL